jgi:hypothetical protein
LLDRRKRSADQYRHLVPLGQNPVAGEQKHDPDQWERERSAAARFLSGYLHLNLPATAFASKSQSKSQVHQNPTMPTQHSDNGLSTPGI